MTKQTRYFMAASGAVLAVGLLAGTIAYYGGGFQAVSASTGPTELSYVPADAAVVAYADVRAIMDSDLRQRLKLAMPTGDGQDEFQQRTGIDVERDIDYVVAAMTQGEGPSGLVVARGRFNNTLLESLAREHGGEVEEYRGRRMVTVNRPPEAPTGAKVRGPQSMTIAFLEPGLIGLGEADAVRRALDAQMTAQSITANAEMMDLVADIRRTDNAWAVGRFDVLASQAQLPEQVTRQIPAVKWFAASGHINGGLAATLRAEARDDQAAENLRDVVRGFLALAKLQAQSDAKAAALVNSIQLTGTGRTVLLSFAVPAEVLQMMGPRAE